MLCLLDGQLSLREAVLELEQKSPLDYVSCRKAAAPTA